ncbi:MAG: porin [bacterium]
MKLLIWNLSELEFKDGKNESNNIFAGIANNSMKRFLFFFIFLSFGLLLMAQEEPSWSVKWKNGVKINRSDGEFKFSLGGRVLYDVMFISQDSRLDEDFEGLNGSEFRRLRWYTSGTLYRIIKFKLQFDFAAGDAGVKDAYVEITKIPGVGNFRAGHFKQPFGYEMATSSKYVNFMERGLTNAFTPERDMGFMIHNREFGNRLGWYLGFFHPAGNVGKFLGNQWRITARLAGLPVYKPDGRYTVLHLGIAAVTQFHDSQVLTLSERPEAHLAPKYANLKFDAVSYAHVAGAEFSFVRGPWAVQSELMFTSVDPAEISDALHTSYLYHAFYIQVSWFITGEHKNYSTSKNCYDIITPNNNLGKGKSGAWELAVRFSQLDLNDRDQNGGGMNDFTIGLSWYLNPATRFMFNYVYSDVFNTGHADIAQVRFQIAF